MPELEMRPIARRRMTDDELELKRYAASELRGNPRCLLTEIVKRCVQFPRKEPTADGHDQERLPSSSSAQA